jgi:Ca2+-binding EF-hand superfamily protein
LEDNKQIGFEQFIKGLDKFGCNFKDFELRALFSKYSHGGYLNYEEFSKAIMDIDINGMVTQPNLLQTKMGTNHFTVTH